MACRPSSTPAAASAARGWRYYRGEHPEPLPPYAAPNRAADLSALPPASVLVAEADALRDEGLAYASRLSSAGVPTEIMQIPGAVHGFVALFPHTRPAQRASAYLVRALRDGLAEARPATAGSS